MFTRKVYASDQEKRRDFWTGFVGWLIGNGLLFCLYSSALNAVSRQNAIGTGPDTLLGIAVLPLVANVGALIYYAFTRSRVALGMLAAFGVTLALGLCGVLLFWATCGIMGTSP